MPVLAVDHLHEGDPVPQQVAILTLVAGIDGDVLGDVTK